MARSADAPVQYPHLEAYRVSVADLPRATKEMNYAENGDCFFRVVQIIAGLPQRAAIVVVEKHQSYPLAEGRWKGFVIEFEGVLGPPDADL